MDESSKWYVGAFMKHKLYRLSMVTVYVDPYICISLGLPKDGRMMDSNFVTSKILETLVEDHTTPIKHLRSNMQSNIMVIRLLTISYAMRNKKPLGRYLGFGKSLTKGYKSCYWHMLIRIRIPRCSIIPYLKA